MHQMQNKCKCKKYGAPLFKWLMKDKLLVYLTDHPPDRDERVQAEQASRQ